MRQRGKGFLQARDARAGDPVHLWNAKSFKFLQCQFHQPGVRHVLAPAG